MSDSPPPLSLFFGAHVPQVRFERALERLDLAQALEECVGPWHDAIEEMIAAGGSKDPAKINLNRLVAARIDGWPDPIETAWQRLVGRRLDARAVPGVHEGQFAGDFLRRGGELPAAADSLRRYLLHFPRDAAGWLALARIEPLPAAARAAFHGENPPDTGLGRVIDALEEDEMPAHGPWLLPYAWLVSQVTTADLSLALEAEQIRERPVPLSGNATVFTFYLVEVEQFRGGATNLSGTEVEARRRLKAVSTPGFKRYLAKAVG